MENTQVEVIKQGAVIDIQVSDQFYKRIQNLTLHFITQKPEEELQQIIEDIKNDKVEDEWTEHLETLLILTNEIEDQARKQNKVEAGVITPGQT